MKKHIKSIAGVTLLEIMLVLAIASMVIVMSIRYYQNATNSQNVNTIMEQIQNITAAADNLAQGGGGYSAASTAAITSVAGAGNLKTPYGTAISISSNSGSVYTVATTGIPAPVCTSLLSKMKSNTKYTSVACTSGSLSYTYNASS